MLFYVVHGKHDDDETHVCYGDREDATTVAVFLPTLAPAVKASAAEALARDLNATASQYGRQAERYVVRTPGPTVASYGLCKGCGLPYSS